MRTVKGRIKKTEKVLEGSVVDNHFLVSVDHDIFDTYSLDEVEIIDELPSELDEAAEKYNEMMSWAWEAPNHPHKAAFIAGAKWQKAKMQEEAVDGMVMDFSSTLPRPQVDIRLDPGKYHTGDKVKVIVIKEDEK